MKKTKNENTAQLKLPSAMPRRGRRSNQTTDEEASVESLVVWRRDKKATSASAPPCRCHERAGVERCLSARRCWCADRIVRRAIWMPTAQARRQAERTRTCCGARDRTERAPERAAPGGRPDAPPDRPAPMLPDPLPATREGYDKRRGRVPLPE